jgi:cyclopropane fatty-acyl-phospholipid synthase-like methyltransferase
MGFVSEYWEDRYKNGGNSGLGSHDLEAINFKANYINNLIIENDIKTLIEFGCGDGNQLKLLKGYVKYFGTDISKTIINKCSEMFNGDTSKVFEHDLNKLLNIKYDLSISLDVIYHLVEDNVFDNYMNNLFNASNLVSIYSTNSNSPSSVKHIKHRNLTEYINNTYPSYKLIDKTDFNKYNVMFLTYKKV